NLQGLQEIKSKLKGIAALVGFAEINTGVGKPAFNSCALVSDGQIKGVQHKTLLPTFDVFDEDRYFEPTNAYETFTVGGTTFGVSICEDIWNYPNIYSREVYAVDPMEKLAAQGCRLVVNLSASPYYVGKETVREKLVKGQSLKHGMSIV